MKRENQTRIHHRVERRKIGGFGWKPDLPDARDHYFAVQYKTMKTLPVKVDLRAKCRPVYS